MDARRDQGHPMLLLGLPPPVWRVVHEYCQQASLHGLRYISSTNLPYIERYLWLGVFLLSVGFAINLIYEVWELWREQPFFITFDSHMTPVYTIPFPSVTICTTNPVKRSVLDLASTNNDTVIFYASLVCPLRKGMRKLINRPENVGNEVYDFLKKVSPSCEEMLKVCSFRGRSFNCCEVFEPEITDYGLCYSFNKLPADRIWRPSTFLPYPGRQYPPNALFWDPDQGYPVQDEVRYNNKEYIFPQWAQIAGEDVGFSLELYQNRSEWQKICSGGYTGFQVKLSNPSDSPASAKVDEHLPLNRETSFMLSPLLYGSHRDLERLPIRVRSCYFQYERRLRYFHMYTFRNCNLECTSVHVLQECGCVTIELPHWNDTRICSSHKDYMCIEIARTKMTTDFIGGREGSNIGSPCNCLPGCQEIIYRATDFYTNYIYSGREPAWANGTVIGANSVTRLSVYYRSNQFLGQHRVMRYTDLKFAGTCGGLLSLLLGFSVISAIEIVYAFILRPLNRALLNYYHHCRRNNVIVVEPVQQQRDTKQQQQIFSVTGIYTSQRKQFIK